MKKIFWFVFLFFVVSVYSKLEFEIDAASYLNNYFIPENQYIVGYQKSSEDDIILYIPQKFQLVNLSKFIVNNQTIFFVPVFSINSSYFMIYENNAKETYNFLRIPIIRFVDEIFSSNQKYDGRIIDEEITAMALVYAKDQSLRNKALNYLFQARDDKLKCFGKPCNIETTLKVLYYLKKANLTNLKIYSDAELWLKSQIKTKDKQYEVLISPSKSTVLCNISNKGNNIPITDSYLMNVSFSDVPLKIKCDSTVTVTFVYQSNSFYRKSSELEYTSGVNCLGRENIFSECNSYLNIIAKELGFDVDLKRWIRNDSLVGKYIDGENPYFITSYYLKRIEENKDMIDWLLFNQRNDGSWNDVYSTILALTFLKDYRNKNSEKKYQESYNLGMIWLLKNINITFDFARKERIFLYEMLYELFNDQYLPIVVNQNWIIDSVPYSLEIKKLELDKSVYNITLVSKNGIINSKSGILKDISLIDVAPKNNLKSTQYLDVLIINVSNNEIMKSQVFRLPVIFEIKPFLKLKSHQINQKNKTIIFEFEKSSDSFVCDLTTDFLELGIDNKIYLEKPKVELGYEIKKKYSEIKNIDFEIELLCKRDKDAYKFKSNFSIIVFPQKIVDLVERNITINKKGQGQIKVAVKNLLNQEVKLKVEILDEPFLFLPDNYILLKPNEIKEMYIKYSIPDIDNYTNIAKLKFSYDIFEQTFNIKIDTNYKEFNILDYIIPLIIILALILFLRNQILWIIKFLIRSLPLFIQKLLPTFVIDWAWKGIPRNKELAEKVKIIKDKEYLSELLDLIEFYKDIGKPEYQIIEMLKKKGFKQVEIETALEEWKKRQQTKQTKK
ncbi:MAG: hypothetical protein QXS41_03200 [Candidatus Woesearchaeota archaeon]